MKQKLLLILMFLCASVSFGQPVLGQPTGPSTMPYPADPNGWSMTDPWVVSGHLTLVNAVPGTADQPLIVWGMDGLLAGAGSLNSYLTPYAKTSSVNTALAGKMNIPSGTSAQYVNGAGGLTTFPSIPAQVNLSAGSGIGITGSYPNLTISNTSASRTINNNVSRSLNSNYTISTTRDAQVSYSVSLSVTNPLLAGSSTASAFLEYSTDGGTNWITVSQAVNQSSVALTVTVAITLPNTHVLSGIMPANALVRVRSATSGTASVTFTRAQEVLL